MIGIRTSGGICVGFVQLELDSFDKVAYIFIVNPSDCDGPSVRVFRWKVACAVFLGYRSSNVAVDCRTAVSDPG